MFFFNGSANFRELIFSKTKLLIYSFLISLFFISSIGGTLYYFIQLIYNHEIDKLREDKKVLNEDIKYLTQTTENLQKKIDELLQKDDEIRIFTNAPKIDKDIRRAGTGGSEEDKISLSSFYKDEGESFYKLKSKIDQLSRIISLQNKISNKMFSNVIENYISNRYTPNLNPVKGGRITTNYGRRIHPVTGERDFHYGIDIGGLNIGTPIYAVADGIILKSQYHSLLGNYILIDHNSREFGFKTIYGHLKKRYVTEGDYVKKGDIIGELGSTGRVTAPHLHYEIHKYGRSLNPLNGYYKYKNSY